MKQRAITSVYIVAISILAILSKLLPLTLGDYLFDIFIVGVTIVASFEICNILEANKRKINKLFVQDNCVTSGVANSSSLYVL